MTVPLIRDLLWITTVALQAVWAVRLWKLRLIGRYPVLFAYLISLTLLGAISFSLYVSPLRFRGYAGYSWFWVLTRPLLWTLFFLLVFEIYSRVLEGYQGVQRLGRLALYGALGSTAAIVALLIRADPFEGQHPAIWLRFWTIQERSVHLAVAAVVAVLLCVKVLFHLKVSRNVQVIFSTFGLYFAGAAAIVILRLYAPPSFQALWDISNILLYALCLGAGMLLFSPAGETLHRAASAPDASRKQVAALQRLDALNDRLVKVLS